MKKKDKKTLAMEAAASKKKSKKEAKSPEMPAMSTEDLSLSYSIERDPKKDENVVLDRHGKAIKAKKKGFWSIVDGSNNESSNGSNANNANNANNGLRAEGNSDAEAPVRKRTKTRSKQKNIRKDNRVSLSYIGCSKATQGVPLDSITIPLSYNITSIA